MAKNNIKRRQSKSLDLSVGKRYRPLSKNIYSGTESILSSVGNTLGNMASNVGETLQDANTKNSALNEISGKIGGAMGKAGAAIQGVAAIADSFKKNASIADTTEQENAIEDLKDTKFDNSSTDSLLDQWDNLNWQKTDYSMKDVRGVSGGEMAMNTISAVGSGAMAGMQVGGPWGALAGAVAGLAGGVGGIFAGNAKARRKAQSLNVMATRANQLADAGFTNSVTDMQLNASRNAMQAAYAADGGSIHIKKKNRGKFTASADRAGMGVQEYARHVLANKDRYSSTLVKRANFARNAAGWKHALGGYKYDGEGDNTPSLRGEIDWVPMSYTDLSAKGMDTDTMRSSGKLPDQGSTYSPIMDSKGAVKAYRSTGYSKFLDDWNEGAYSTGLFEGQLGAGPDGLLMKDIQKGNRDRTEVLINPNFYVPAGIDGAAQFIPRSRRGVRTTLEDGSTSWRYEDTGLADRIVAGNSVLIPDSTSLLHEKAHAGMAIPQRNKIDEILGNELGTNNNTTTKYNDDYWDNSNEVYSRLMEVRKAAGLDPKKRDYNVEDLKEIRKATDPGKDSDPVGYQSKMTNFLNRYDDNTLVRLLNEVALNNGIQRQSPYREFDTANFAAMGGKINTSTHGGDFSNGVTLVDNGGTHEQNPYEGVPMGIAPDGQPNLVEEGEVIYNDYVFSNRLHLKENELKKARLPKKYKNYTFALAAEDVSKESAERPNDPISKRGLEDTLGKLANIQEEQRMKKGKRGTQQMMAFGGRKYDGTKPIVPVNRNPFTMRQSLDLSRFDLSNPFNNNIIKKTDPFTLQTNYTVSPKYGSSPSFKYENPSPGESKGSSDAKTDKSKSLDTSLRYAPAIGSTLGALNSVFQKPDYSNSDLILNTVNNLSRDKVHPQTLMNKMTYNPLDRNYYLNQLKAQAGATRGAITNSGGNAGSVMAGLLAADYNAQNAVGNTLMQMEQYNDAQRQRVAEFNRGTDQYNSQALMNADLQNAKLAEARDEMKLKGMTQVAAMREATDTGLANSRSVNFTNALDNLGAIGQDNMAQNWRNRLVDVGYFGAGADRIKKCGGKLLTKRNRRRR